MHKTNNRFALVYNHRNQQLKHIQVSGNFEPFPNSVQVGDLFQGQPIVALAADINGFARSLKDEFALYEQGKQRLLTLQPQQEYRYYLLFRFYITDPAYATTVEEKVTIDKIGETQTVRVMGCHDPETVDIVAVWSHLQPQATPVGSVLRGGPLDGATASVCRSLDTIDTETSHDKDWRPLGTQVLDNPCPTMTVEAKPA